MFTIKRPQIDKKKRFTLLAVGFAAFLLIAGTFGLIAVWVLRDPADQIRLWHIAELSALAALLLGGVALALIRRPQEKPLLAQFFLLSLIILSIGFIPFDIDALVSGINISIPAFGLGNIPFNTIGFAFLLLAGVFVLAYPDRRALLSFNLKGSISMALLLLTLMLAVESEGMSESVLKSAPEPEIKPEVLPENETVTPAVPEPVIPPAVLSAAGTPQVINSEMRMTESSSLAR